MCVTVIVLYVVDIAVVIVRYVVVKFNAEFGITAAVKTSQSRWVLHKGHVSHKERVILTYINTFLPISSMLIFYGNPWS